MNINITYLSALGLAGAANKASSASSSNRLLLDGLGLALLVTLLTPADLDRELMEVTDWVDLTLLALGFSSSDQLSSYQERIIWHFKIQKTLWYSLVYNLVHNIPTVHLNVFYLGFSDMKCRDHLHPDIFINYQSYSPRLTPAFFASLLQPLEGLLPLRTWALLLLEAGERTHSLK